MADPQGGTVPAPAIAILDVVVDEKSVVQQLDRETDRQRRPLLDPQMVAEPHSQERSQALSTAGEGAGDPIAKGAIPYRRRQFLHPSVEELAMASPRHRQRSAAFCLQVASPK